MTQIIRTKGYKYSINGQKYILLPVKRDEHFKGIVLEKGHYGGTFILHSTPVKRIVVQYRLDDTIYPFVDWTATNGDVFKHKDNYYMWTSTRYKDIKHLELHPAIYDFKKKKLIDFASLDPKYPMTIVKMKVCDIYGKVGKTLISN